MINPVAKRSHDDQNHLAMGHLAKKEWEPLEGVGVLQCIRLVRLVEKKIIFKLV